MRWILLDVLLVLLALGLLVAVGLSVWRRVRALGAEVSRASARIEEATAQLERASTRDPAAPSGVPSHLSS